MDIGLFKKYARGKKTEAPKSNEVWLYTRVSSRDQRDNNSLDNQKDSGYDYAMKNGLLITRTFGGTFESASGDFTRKEFMRLIDEVRKAEIRPRAIMIFIMSRFSRTGAGGIALADELVEQLKVHLIEISSGKSTETEKGKVEIYTGLIRAREENLNRLEVTIPGMKRFLKNGYRLGNSPRGWDHYGPRVKDLSKISKEQKLLLNDEGRIIQQAWKLKIQGERDFIILRFLHSAGVKVSKQSLSDMWRNPVYCGVSVNSLLEDEVVIGKWEPMITQEDFFYVQELIKENKQGYEVDKVCADRPLQGFIRCPLCGTKMTGYLVKMKGVHTYKCQKCRDVSINANTTPRSHGIGVHQLFIKFLSQYQLKPELLEPFKIQMKMTMEAITKDNKNAEVKLRKELSEYEEKIKELKRKFITSDIDKDTYQEFKNEWEDKISRIKCQLNDSPTKISNQDFFIENSLDVVQNISDYWVSGDIETKRRIQRLVFPEGLVMDTKKRVYLTNNTNCIFKISKRISGECRSKNENDPEKISESSYSVAGAGFEPTTFGL